jgi:hypothetical protein
MLCDRKGETVTIIKSSNGYIFGGYSTAPWDVDRHGRYTNAPNSFIFTLSNPNAIPPTQFLLKDPANAVYHYHSYGPSFGSGADIRICDLSNSHSNNYTCFPGAYADTVGKGDATFTGAKYFTVGDIEVFYQE